MKKTLILLIGIMATLNAQSVIEQCDINNNGVIDTAILYGLKTPEQFNAADAKIKALIIQEKKCAAEYLITQKESEKFVKVLALLDTIEARNMVLNEIKNVETALDTEHDTKEKEKLLMRLNILKTTLERLVQQHV